MDAFLRESHRILKAAFGRFQGVDPVGRDVLDLAELGVRGLNGIPTQRPGDVNVADIRQPWLRRVLVTWIDEVKPTTSEVRRAFRACAAASRALDMRSGGGQDPPGLPSPT